MNNKTVTRNMICLFMLDDFTAITSKSADYNSSTGMSVTAEAMWMGAALDIGVCSISHSLSILSEVIRQNSSAYITTGLPTEEPRLINNTFNTDYDQSARIKVLHCGEFVIFNGEIHDKAVLAKFDELVIEDKLDENVRKSNLSDLLNCCGNEMWCSDTNFLDQIFSTQGLKVFESEALPQEHLSFLASYMMRWIYFKRIYEQ